MNDNQIKLSGISSLKGGYEYTVEEMPAKLLKEVALMVIENKVSIHLYPYDGIDILLVEWELGQGNEFGQGKTLLSIGLDIAEFLDVPFRLKRK